MDHFTYRNGRLYAEDMDLEALADEFGTPTYVYSASTFLDHLDRFREAFSELRPTTCFAVKSCSNISILRLLGRRGAGMDIVSGGELRRAMAAGIDPALCVYAGVGKTDEEITFAIESGVDSSTANQSRSF